jgi:hypothetical protein
MNASCALQHFCDLHGPQILLCTDTKAYVQDSNDNDDEDLKTFYSQYIKSENPQEKVECKVKKMICRYVSGQCRIEEGV